MDAFDGIPSHLLGYNIKSRTRIIYYWIIPTCLELVSYIIHMTADIAVTYQHFHDKNPIFGGLTLSFICLPAIICFILILTSSVQWPDTVGICNCENWKFFGLQLFNLIIFPFAVIYRFCRKIFWSIESLFYDKDTYERQNSVSKAAESSPLELYHFVQAYTQSAPQIILQLFILLRENMFRNYETTNIQILSVAFSLINLSVITVSYQRFESQKIVGRHYPWATFHEIQIHKQKFRHSASISEIRQSIENNKRQRKSDYFPENDKILQKLQIETTMTAPGSQSITKLQKEHEHEMLMDSKNTSSSDEIDIVHPKIDSTKNNNDYCNNKTDLKVLNQDTIKNLAYADCIDPIHFVFNVTDDEKLKSCQKNNKNNQENVKQQQQIEIGEEEHRPIVAESLKTNSDQFNKKKEILANVMDDLNAIEVIGDEDIDNFNKQNLNQNRNGNKTEKENVIETNNFDAVPETPPPPLPPKKNIKRNYSFERTNCDQTSPEQTQNIFNPLKRLSTYKDMLLFNAESYIKDNIPHPPRFIVDRTDFNKQEKMKESKTDGNIIKSMSSSFSSLTKTENDQNTDQNVIADTVDFFLPTRRKMLHGIEQDDFFGKCVAFFGWFMFIYMRMISLSVFSVFYPTTFFYLLAGHYILMLLCLSIDKDQFKENLKKIIFYLFLSYCYIFVIVEFRIQFKRIRCWYIGFFLLMMTENLTMTILWYSNDELDLESWAFDFLFSTTLGSGFLFTACLIVYYAILKPNNIILVENEK